jgi:adenylosuccinate lyase
MRERGQSENDLFTRLADDPRLQMSLSEIESLVADRSAFTGVASAQVAAIVAQVEKIVAQHPTAAAYNPPEIL